jgi:NADH-quinone oxidoreductase subunit E
MTEECLAGCDHAPCMLINEKMHKCVRVEDLDRILGDPNNDKLDVPRCDLFDAPREA